MQARPWHLKPTIFSSQTKLPLPMHQPPLPRPAGSATIPRATSVSTKAHLPTHPKLEENDSKAAFWDYQFLFLSQRSETAQPFLLRLVDGAIPPDFPSGTYYLTGPGLFTDDHGSTVHPLDGHGYVRAFTFDKVTREVKFMAKYVKTEALEEEYDPKSETWRFTYRGPFSVLKGGKMVGNTKVMKNVANTTVLKWGGKLLCLWEGGNPYEIEPGTLDTIGSYHMMDGCDSEVSDRRTHEFKGWDVVAAMVKPLLHGVFKMAPKRLLSHYKVDAKKNRLLTISCNAEDLVLPVSNFKIYEYDSNFKPLQKQEFKIPDHLMIHDWAFTDTHYIIFCNRIKLDILGAMAAVSGKSPMISALSVNPSKPTSPVYLLPRFPSKAGDKDRDWRVPVEAPVQMWVLHVGNAFETQDDQGNMDIQISAVACSYNWFNFMKLFGYNWQNGKLDPSIMNLEDTENEFGPHLVLVSIKLGLDGNCRCNAESITQWKEISDFPIINPSFSGKKNSYIYAATTSGSRQALPKFPFDTLLKLNLSQNSAKTWSTASRNFIGEPVFVPKGDEEDDGFLLVVEYAVSVQKCYLVILDAKKIGEADALVARLEVPKHLTFPLGFHGFWDRD